MYIDVVPNRNSPPAVLLRESVRQGSKVRKLTVANLSSWSPARIQALRRLLRGEFDHLANTDPVQGPVFGLLFTLKQIADQIGLTAALGNSRLGKLALFLVLARLGHQGSRLSAVRWASDHAVAEVLGLENFDEEDLYAALDELSQRQEKIELQLYALYRQRRGSPPHLFLYDVTSSYLEGEQNFYGAYGYNRDGKRNKLQIVIGLLADEQGEPLAVRVFAGNTSDPVTVTEQIQIVREQFGVQELIFVGDRGMVKSKGQQALEKAGSYYITALTDPQIRRLLAEAILQLDLFSEQICEVESGERRYVLRKNPEEAARQRHRLEDKLDKLEIKLQQRNQQVSQSKRCEPQAGLRHLQAWIVRYKLTPLVQVRLQERTLVLDKQAVALEQELELAGCYVVVSDIPQEKMKGQQLHDGYMALQKVERDFRTLKTGLLEVRPVFVRKQSRTRGHVLACMLALKLTREMERRLQTVFGTTAHDPHTVTLPDALAALGRLCLLHYTVDEKTTATRLPQPNQRQKEILQALGVSILGGKM